MLQLEHNTSMSQKKNKQKNPVALNLHDQNSKLTNSVHVSEINRLNHIQANAVMD